MRQTAVGGMRSERLFLTILVAQTGSGFCMAAEFRSSFRKIAGSILASMLVLIFGGLGIVLGLMIAGRDAKFLFWTVLIVVVGLTAIFSLIRACTSVNVRGQYLWVFGRKTSAEPEYEPKRATRTVQAYGDNRPPTVEEVRDMKDGLHNWVPARTYQKRKGRRNLGRDSREKSGS